jgi:hypothetical protein
MTRSESEVKRSESEAKREASRSGTIDEGRETSLGGTRGPGAPQGGLGMTRGVPRVLRKDAPPWEHTEIVHFCYSSLLLFNILHKILLGNKRSVQQIDQAMAILITQIACSGRSEEAAKPEVPTIIGSMPSCHTNVSTE